MVAKFAQAKLAAAMFAAGGIAGPAVANDNPEFAAAIGVQGYGRCHMDSCSFFIIDGAAPIATGRDGVLYVVSSRTWGAIYGRRGDGDEHEYDRPPASVGRPTSQASIVYCSKKRPIIFGYYDGAWYATPLRPGDQAAIFGANESALQFYFAACHRSIVRDPYAPSTPNLAKRLGYDFSGSSGWAQDDTRDDLKPLDMLK